MKKIKDVLDQIVEWCFIPVVHFALLVYCFLRTVLGSCTDEWCYSCFKTGIWLTLLTLMLVLFVANLLGAFKRKSSAPADDPEESA